ncbi:MAG: restriction endonuclease subunit S [Polyangia bacterium]
MKLPAYPKYKPSGVEWLGDVPESWEVKQLKWAVMFQRGHDLPADEREEGSVPLVSSSGISATHSRAVAKAPGIVTGRYGTIGQFHLITNDYWPLNTTLYAIDLHGNEPRFLARMLAHLSPLFLLNAVKSAVPGIDRNDIHPIAAAVPPVAEQRTIADFLDREIQKIDTLVAKKRTLVERLKEKRAALISRTVTRGLPPDAARAAGLDPHPKLKPSGIDWLGDVPAHWEVKRLGHLSIVVRGASPRPAGDPRYFEGDFIPWITVGELTKDNSPYLTATESMLTREGAAISRIMQEGTLVLTNSGATLGVPKILGITGCANDGVVAFENLRSDANRLFLYYFLSSVTENLRDRIKQGSGQPNLNTDIVKALVAPYPSSAEQSAIVDYLDGETLKVDRLVAKVESAIERLQEYRTALITAAVTGKIDVRQASSSG